MAGQPFPVLERPYHLSYPFVFSHEEAVYIIPESSANRSIELYRATAFPQEWVLECVLVEDAAASDATLIEKDGRFWLFATDCLGGSSWDALCLWSAETLHGPFLPHKHNPVLIDAGGARPAGRMLVEDGRLLRPTQDCRASYGAAMVLKHVTELDDDAFSEELVQRLDPAKTWLGTHSINRSSSIEAIDIFSLRVPQHRS
jgi:hypothetical protein